LYKKAAFAKCAPCVRVLLAAMEENNAIGILGTYVSLLREKGDLTQCEQITKRHPQLTDEQTIPARFRDEEHFAKRWL